MPPARTALAIHAHYLRLIKGHGSRQPRVIIRLTVTGANLLWRRPDTGDRAPARRTFSFRRDLIRLDEIAITFDQRFPALRAAGVFPFADAARQIPGIDEMEAFAGPDLRGANQMARGGIGRAGHFVVLVKRGDVPRNVAAQAGDESRDGAQFLLAVVEAG